MIITIMVLILNGIFPQNNDTKVNEIPGTKSASIEKVNAINVCMGMATNRVFSRDLIPAVVDGKTYYGCCEGCQSKLLEDPSIRVAIDPVTGVEVDKAVAVIGALPSGVVHYFESEENMKQFEKRIQSTE